MTSDQIIEEIALVLRLNNDTATDVYDLSTRVLNRLEELGLVKNINERLKDSDD